MGHIQSAVRIGLTVHAGRVLRDGNRVETIVEFVLEVDEEFILQFVGKRWMLDAFMVVLNLLL